MTSTLNGSKAQPRDGGGTEERSFCSAKSQIRERSFNLIAPRIPITFDPSDEKHLHEIKKTNCLDKHAIRRAKWIKPAERRQPGQANTYRWPVYLQNENQANKAEVRAHSMHKVQRLGPLHIELLVRKGRLQ